MMLILLGVSLLMPGTPPTTQNTICNCAQARLKNSWCYVCKVGYVAGVAIKYPDLHEVMDAHGHDLDPRMEHCESCAKALVSDGFCERCKLGYIRKQIYFSRLTWLVAKGRQVDVSQIVCAGCRQNAQKYGWCEGCKIGRVGNVVLGDRELFRQLCEQYDFLMAALKVAERCELCACCMFNRAICPKCNIDYSKGLPAEPPASQPAGPASKPVETGPSGG